MLRRHVKRFCQGNAGVVQDTTPLPKKHRIKLACDLCHEKKLKCTGTFPCRTCEQQGRLCTAARVANADKNDSNQAPPSAGASSDINSGAIFSKLQASAEVPEIGSSSLNGRLNFQDINGGGDDSFGNHDTSTRNIHQHMISHPVLDSSVHDSTTGGFTHVDGLAAVPVYSQAHSSISASFEPLFQAMDVMIQQEDAVHLTPQMEQSTMTTGTTPSRPPINCDFMSLWDEGSYDDLWQSPSNVRMSIFHWNRT